MCGGGEQKTLNTEQDCPCVHVCSGREDSALFKGGAGCVLKVIEQKTLKRTVSGLPAIAGRSMTSSAIQERGSRRAPSHKAAQAADDVADRCTLKGIFCWR